MAQGPRNTRRAAQDQQQDDGGGVDDRPFAPPLEGEVQQAGGPSGDSALAVLSTGSGAISELREEIDQQIATAKKYPRSITGARRSIETLATIDQRAAQDCMYVLERTDRQGKKVPIIGPSIRFAEIVFQSWGNCRVAARMTKEDQKRVEATGVYHDLETNAAVAKSVQRGITTSTGKRYGNDMIMVTANAAASIALRNAILAGVPRAVWSGAFEKARAVATGDASTLNQRRAEMVRAFKEHGATQEQVWQVLGVRGSDDVTLEVMLMAAGLLNAIGDGAASLDSLLAERAAERATPGNVDRRLGAAFAGADPGKTGQEPPKTPAGPDAPAGDGKAAQGQETPAAQAAAAGADPKTGELPAKEGPAPAPEKPAAPDPAPPPAPPPPPPPAEEPAAETEAATGVFDAPAAEDDADTSGASDEQDEDGAADAVDPAWAAFERALAAAPGWDEARAAIGALARTPWWAENKGLQDAAYRRTWNRVEELDVKPNPGKDPAAFRLWLVAQDDAETIENMWFKLAQSALYTKLPEPGKNDLIAAKTARKKVVS